VMNAGGDALAGAPGRSMLAAAFGNQASDDREQWFAAAEGFIKRAGSRRRTPGEAGSASGRGNSASRNVRTPGGPEGVDPNASAQSQGAGYARSGGAEA